MVTDPAVLDALRVLALTEMQLQRIAVDAAEIPAGEPEGEPLVAVNAFRGLKNDETQRWDDYHDEFMRRNRQRT